MKVSGLSKICIVLPIVIFMCYGCGSDNSTDDDSGEMKLTEGLIEDEAFKESLQQLDSIANVEMTEMNETEQKEYQENIVSYVEKQKEKIDKSPFRDIVSGDSLVVVYQDIISGHAVSCDVDKIMAINKVVAEDPKFIEFKKISRENSKKVIEVYKYSKSVIDSCKSAK